MLTWGPFIVSVDGAHFKTTSGLTTSHHQNWYLAQKATRTISEVENGNAHQRQIIFITIQKLEENMEKHMVSTLSFGSFPEVLPCWSWISIRQISCEEDDSSPCEALLPSSLSPLARFS